MDSFELNPIIAGLSDRRAQRECIESLQATIKAGGNDFLAELCVGAGKTNTGLATFAWYRSINTNARLFVVVPNDVIRQGWVSDAKSFGLNLSGSYDGQAIRNLFNDGWGEALDGIVITYQTLSRSPDLVSQIVMRLSGQCVAIFDEVHHGGDGLAWGDSAQVAFSQASFRIGMTGTPYRHDTAPIPWVKYTKHAHDDGDGPGVVVPQYHYRYGDGLADRIVAPIDFQWIGGCVERSAEGDHVDDGLPMAFDFADDYSDVSSGALVERMMNKRLSVALAADNPALIDAHSGLVGAVIKALEQAKATYENAGAAIVCDGMAQLKAIKASLESRGVDVRYTTHKDASSDNVVRDFNAGQGDVLLSILQLAEGVSIPRLQVLGFATTITTQLFFTQVVGRLARLIKGVPYFLQHGTVIAFRDPRFVEYAEAFKNPDLEVQQRKIIEPPRFKLCPSCSAQVAISAEVCPHCGHVFKRWPPPPTTEFTHSGEALRVGMTLDGKTYSREEVEAIEVDIEASGIFSEDSFFASLPRDAQLRLYLAARHARTQPRQGV